MPPPSDWDLYKVGLCLPPQTGFSRKKGLQRTVLYFLPQTGLSRKQAMPPPSDWGPLGGRAVAGVGSLVIPPAAEGPPPH